jgi:polynucleotide 5'-kinase involved in rRNA processing
MVVSAARLAQAAREAGTDVLIYDTSGFVGAADGGAHLKLAKIELLQPSVVFAIQRDQELESVLTPLRHSRRPRLVELRPSPAAQRRDARLSGTSRSAICTLFQLGCRWLLTGRAGRFPAPHFPSTNWSR